MALLAPLALLLGLLAVPILILYMLKLRRREVEVSSTLLWQLLLRDREANAPWQRLKRNLLLLLQLLLLAALVFALARPFFRVPAIATGTLVVLLDASASMQAVDVDGAPTRFEQARAAVRDMIDGLGSGGSMSLILVGEQPEVLAPTTTSKEVLREALGRARPAEVPADWEAAAALAAGSVRVGDPQNSVIVVVSDGGLPEDLPPLPSDVRYLPIGQSADNLALQALALRTAEGGPELFASVTNFGDAERAVIVSISIDGQLSTAKELVVPPGGKSDLVLSDLPQGPAVYQAQLSLPAGQTGAVDALPLDDTAWAVYQPPAAGRVLVVTPGNVFLEQVFAALSEPLGLQPFRLKQDQPLPPEPFDLYVLDGVYTSTLPAGADLMLINPPSNDLFQVGGLFTNTALLRMAQNDPLTRFVDWSDVNLLAAHQVALPSWAHVVVEAQGGPLVFAGESGGRRVVVLTFDLHASDLPLKVTYPILMANVLNYLSPAQAFSAPDGLRPGESLTIKPSAGAEVTIEDPDGTRYAAVATEAGVIFAETNTLGLYAVRSGQGILGQFAVNLFDPAESNIRPAETITVGRSQVTPTAREEQGQLEIWPWIAAAAFLLLLVEWWVYHRGATVPRLRGQRLEVGGEIGGGGAGGQGRGR